MKHAFALEHWQPQADEPSFLNVGTGVDLSIRELAENVAKATGFNGAIDWDVTKPDGTPKKQLDVSRLSELGWRAKISLADGYSKQFLCFDKILLLQKSCALVKVVWGNVLFIPGRHFFDMKLSSIFKPLYIPLGNLILMAHESFALCRGLSEPSETFIYDLVTSLESNNVENYVLSHKRLLKIERPLKGLR